MNFHQSDTGASCQPHHLLHACSNKRALIIAQSVYIGRKSADQGPPLTGFLSYEVCMCGGHTTQTLCRSSRSLCKSEPSPLGMQASCS